MSQVPDLKHLFFPRSVAIVGASANFESISGRPLKLLHRYGFRGRIYPVNPNHSQLMGYPCYPDLLSLPETPDVVLIGVRASLVPDILTQAAARRVPFAVIFSSGFAESGEITAQERLVEIASSGGVRLLGPNCQGLANLAEGIPLSFSASLDTDLRPAGNLAYVSQSGAFGFASFALAMQEGVGFRYVVTTGNQVDLDVVDMASYVLEDEAVEGLVLYLEGLNEGSRFLDLALTARKRDIPLAVLKVGKSETAKHAAKSHTAALTGDEQVWETIFHQFGILQLEDPDDIQDFGKMMVSKRRSKGRRVAVLTTSGGAGIIMTDRLDDAGLSVPPFPEEIQHRLVSFIPPFGSPRNPVDMTAQVINDPEGFSGCLSASLEGDLVDMGVVIISMITGHSGRRMAEDLSAFSQRTSKPLACCWLIDDEHGKENMALLEKARVPLFRSLRRSARGLAWVAQWSEDIDPIPSFPSKEPRLTTLPERLTEHDAKLLLQDYGISTTRERLCRTLEEVLSAAHSIGFPVALKVMSPDIPHKTEAGVVELDLADDEDVKNAYGRLLENASRHVKGAEIQGILVQEMVSGGLEFFVGVKRDPLFGPMVLLGLGGIYVEVLKDFSMRKAPVSVKTALKMIRELRGFPLLEGVRGGVPRDQEALAEAVSRISFLAVNEDLLGELDVNPLFVMPKGKGVVAADALALRR